MAWKEVGGKMIAPMEAKGKIAVLIPCHNEAATIGKVVDDFKGQLPQAEIYVFDNCCTDETPTIAADHGATVLPEPRIGKGYVIEAMLDRVEADYHVMVDGDDTYPAEKVKELLGPVMDSKADMVVGARSVQRGDKSFRPFHVMGNGLVTRLVNWIFHADLTDIMSGYRAFNRRVAERIPVVSAGFEVETEMTIQMLYHRLRIVEVQVPYRSRPEGSHSKLNTFRDGMRVLWKIFCLFRSTKPLTFFGTIGLVFFALGLLAGAPPIYGFIASGYTEVKKFPLAILATGLMLLAFGNVFLGILLHAINWRFEELHNVLVRKRS